MVELEIHAGVPGQELVHGEPAQHKGQGEAPSGPPGELVEKPAQQQVQQQHIGEGPQKPQVGADGRLVKEQEVFPGPGREDLGQPHPCGVGRSLGQQLLCKVHEVREHCPYEYA